MAESVISLQGLEISFGEKKVLQGVEGRDKGRNRAFGNGKEYDPEGADRAAGTDWWKRVY